MKTLIENVKKVIYEAAGRSVTLSWDMGNPDQYAGDWQDKGIYLDNVGRGEITVSGTDKDLLNWLVDDYGMDKREAQQEIKKGKRVKI